MANVAADLNLLRCSHVYDLYSSKLMNTESVESNRNNTTTPLGLTLQLPKHVCTRWLEDVRDLRLDHFGLSADVHLIVVTLHLEDVRQLRCNRFGLVANAQYYVLLGLDGLESTVLTLFQMQRDEDKGLAIMSCQFCPTVEKDSLPSQEETLKQEKTVAAISHMRKVHCFEKYNWFISSGNYLIISGCYAHDDKMTVTCYLSEGDLYIHADLDGASSTVVRNYKAEHAIPPLILNLAGCVTDCHSQAWDPNIMTREYFMTGIFLICGENNFHPPSSLVMDSRMLFRLDESSLGSDLNERWGREEAVGLQNSEDTGPVRREGEADSLQDNEESLSDSESGDEVAVEDKESSRQSSHNGPSADDKTTRMDGHASASDSLFGEESLPSISPELEDLIDKALGLGPSKFSSKLYMCNASQDKSLESLSCELKKASMGEKPYISKVGRKTPKEDQKCNAAVASDEHEREYYKDEEERTRIASAEEVVKNEKEPQEVSVAGGKETRSIAGCLQLVFFFFFLLLCVSPVHSQLPLKGSCGDVMKLTSCFPYLLPSSTFTPPPSPICCHSYSSIFLVGNYSHPCLCKLFHKPFLLGKVLNTSRLLFLSSQCFGDRSDFVDPLLFCEGSALLALKSHFRNTTLLDWSFPTDYCSWRGVLCENSSVVSLNLSYMELGGDIARSIGDLRRLEILDLRANHLKGNIPSVIGNCSFMRILDLSENCLYGDIPDVLTKFPNLSVLNFSYNDLSGLVPAGFKPESFLGNPRLRVIPWVRPLSRPRAFLLQSALFWTVLGVILTCLVLLLGYFFFWSRRPRGNVIWLGAKLPRKCY